MKIVQSGVPSKVAAETAAGGDALVASIVVPASPVKSFSQIIGEILSGMASAAILIIDPNTRKITAATGETADEILAAATDSRNAGIIRPEEDQVGRSLTWAKDVNFDDDIQDVQAGNAVNAAINAVKPRRSVESLAAAVLGAEYEGSAPVVVIDQKTGTVTVVSRADSAGVQAAIDAVANAGDRLQIALSDDSEEGDAPKLIFEGGAV